MASLATVCAVRTKALPSADESLWRRVHRSEIVLSKRKRRCYPTVRSCMPGVHLLYFSLISAVCHASLRRFCKTLLICLRPYTHFVLLSKRTANSPKHPFPAQQDTIEKCSNWTRFARGEQPRPRLWCCSVGGPFVCIGHQGAFPLGIVLTMFVDEVWSRSSETLTLCTESLPMVVETSAKKQPH